MSEPVVANLTRIHVFETFTDVDGTVWAWMGILKRWIHIVEIDTSGFVDRTTSQIIGGIKTFQNVTKFNSAINFAGNNTLSAPGAWLFNSDDYYNFSRQGIGDAFRIGVNSGANFNESFFALRVNVAPSNPLDVVRLQDLSAVSTPTPSDQSFIIV